MWKMMMICKIFRPVLGSFIGAWDHLGLKRSQDPPEDSRTQLIRWWAMAIHCAWRWVECRRHDPHDCRMRLAFDVKTDCEKKRPDPGWFGDDVVVAERTPKICKKLSQHGFWERFWAAFSSYLASKFMAPIGVEGRPPTTLRRSPPRSYAGSQCLALRRMFRRFWMVLDYHFL